MVRSSGQQKCALIFCGVAFLVLGSGITASGFIYDYLDPYDNVSTPQSSYFTHVQYWLGIPLFIFGIFVIATTFCKIKCLMTFGFVAASLLLVLSICGIILEGPSWRYWLQISMKINDENCKDSNDICTCASGRPVSILTCDETHHVTVINSIIVVFSALAVVVCQFCCFVYCRIMGWMLHIRYDTPVEDYYAKTFGNPYNNGAGHQGRANQVVLDRLG